MKILLKKGTRQIDQKKKEECLRDWGSIAYGNSSLKSPILNNAINMNDIFNNNSPKDSVNNFSQF